jgi:polypeptide N-acetylgalactosaminyltransferase
MQSDPFPTPTMVGLVAANRNYWFEIGEYDDGMKIMGEESIELSFRAWMCGENNILNI